MRRTSAALAVCRNDTAEPSRHCDQPTSWLGVWGRIAPILPSLLFAERGQQGGFESFIVTAQDAGSHAPKSRIRLTPKHFTPTDFVHGIGKWEEPAWHHARFASVMPCREKAAGLHKRPAPRWGRKGPRPLQLAHRIFDTTELGQLSFCNAQVFYFHRMDYVLERGRSPQNIAFLCPGPMPGKSSRAPPRTKLSGGAGQFCLFLPAGGGWRRSLHSLPVSWVITGKDHSSDPEIPPHKQRLRGKSSCSAQGCARKTWQRPTLPRLKT